MGDVSVPGGRLIKNEQSQGRLNPRWALSWRSAYTEYPRPRVPFSLSEGLETAKRPAQKIAELAAWTAPPWRRRLTVGISVVGIAIGIVTLPIGARPSAWTARTCARRKSGRLDPASRTTICILHLHPARLARDYAHLPARRKRIDHGRLQRGVRPHAGRTSHDGGPPVDFGSLLAAAARER